MYQITENECPNPVKGYSVYCVVVNYNDYQTCCDFIDNSKDNNLLKKIVIVDNNSTDDSYEKLKQSFSSNEKIDVIKSDKNGGYGYGNNVGIRFCFQNYQPSHIIISNPDVKFDSNVVLQLCQSLDSDKNNFIAAPKMIQKDGSLGILPWKIPSKKQYIFLSSIFFSDNNFRLSVNDLKKDTQLVDCVAGAFLMFKASDLIKNGVYDENIFLFGEETSIGIKYKDMGLKTIFLPNIEYVHLGSESINKSASELRKMKFTLQSRFYVLRQYYRIKGIEIPLVRFIFWLQVLEWTFYLKIRDWNICKLLRRWYVKNR